ncbi:MAG TPA: hypothetical protein VFE96_02270, partial [Candidatus Bathyarchaeia archaeon]|nr:hypothetical protein [Candidatus Bathyarchaeia archaeon]
MTSDDMRAAHDVMLAIKGDQFVGDPPILMSQLIAKTVRQYLANLPFAYFFQPGTVLVPVPKSSLMQPNTLWAPHRIATALTKEGIGSIPGPLTTIGIPFRGEKADNDEVSKSTGKTLGQLQDETEVDTTLPRGEIFGQGFTPPRFAEARIDLPFIRISRTSQGDSVKVGPISVNAGRLLQDDVDDVEVGPFNFNPCDWITSNKDDAEKTWFSRDRGLGRESRRRRGRFASRWLAKANEGNSYLSASPEGVQARWNGSSLRLKGDSMKMAVGQDGFV